MSVYICTDCVSGTMGFTNMSFLCHQKFWWQKKRHFYFTPSRLFIQPMKEDASKCHFASSFNKFAKNKIPSTPKSNAWITMSKSNFLLLVYYKFGDDLLLLDSPWSNPPTGCYIPSNSRQALLATLHFSLFSNKQWGRCCNFTNFCPPLVYMSPYYSAGILSDIL